MIKSQNLLPAALERFNDFIAGDDRIKLQRMMTCAAARFMHEDHSLDVCGAGYTCRINALCKNSP
ncbi:MAG: hypothetical protein U0105_15560 [Candidatus Obscuribacterales bacterium]